jgi:hypothetical protein
MTQTRNLKTKKNWNKTRKFNKRSNNKTRKFNKRSNNKTRNVKRKNRSRKNQIKGGSAKTRKYMTKTEGILKKDGLKLEEVREETDFKKLKYDDKKELILTAVKQNGMALEHVESIGKNYGDFFERDFINNKDIVIKAVEQNGLALQFASPSLRGDYTILSQAVKQDGRALKFAHSKLYQYDNYKEIALEAIMKNVEMLDYVTDEVKKSSNFLRRAQKFIRDNTPNKNSDIIIQKYQSDENLKKYVTEEILKEFNPKNNNENENK